MALDLSNHGILDFLSCPKTVPEKLSLSGPEADPAELPKSSGQILSPFQPLKGTSKNQKDS
jgi:hypothetical protein